MGRSLRQWHCHVPAGVALLMLICASAQLTAAEPSKPVVPLTAFSLSTAGVLSAPAPDTIPAPSSEWLATTLAGPVPAHLEGGAVLADGDLLVGWPISLQAGVLTLATGAFGTLQIPAQQLSSVIISVVPTAAPVEVPAGFSGAVLANGERVAGQPSFLNQAEAGIDNGKRVVQVPRARLSALVLRAPGSPSKTVIRLRLATGDRVSGTITASNGGWSLRHALGEWTIPTHAIRAWWSEGPERLPLGALLPTATYSGAFDPPLVPLTIDRQTTGDWLYANGVRCDRGLALRAGTTVSIPVPPGPAWKSLVAVLAVDHGGGAVFTVNADGRAVYTSPALTMRSPATAIAVPVVGAKVLTLTVVNVQDNDPPATAVWAWATLVR